MSEPLTLIGRSSSHFTRVTRIFAAELGVKCGFEPVLDIQSTDPQTFDNPLLTVPSLRTPEGTWFGSLPICRELARRSLSSVPLVWPEDHVEPLSSNAQEVTTSAMTAGVSVIMARGAGLGDDHALLVKPRARLQAAIDWLEEHLDSVFATLPEKRLSFLEVSTYCFLTHLGLRELGSIANRPRLTAFCEAFGARPSAVQTPYFFDQPRPATAS
jgi:glutathione S-transferase